ncbi:MAG TPA: DUF3592 domain-containing protein [Burkholderiaceae bacterium]|nr:DUF3592 domain-containing protein [Burkholderiaceae bacterium]
MVYAWAWVELCLALVLLGRGIVLLRTRWAALRAARRARQWHRTAAVLQLRRLQSAPDGRQHRVQVRYRYEWGGQVWLGERIHHCYAPSTERELHKRLFERLQSGLVVAVHLNPEQPEESTLIIGVNRRLTCHALEGMGWLLASAALASHAWAWTQEPVMATEAHLGTAMAVLAAAGLVGVARHAYGRVLGDLARAL